MKALEFLKRPGDVSRLRLAVVTGAEEYLRSRVIERLLEGFGPEVVRDVVEGPATREVGRFDFAGLLDTLRTPSLFGGESVVVLTGADALLAEHAAAFARFLERGEACHRLIVEGEALCAKPGGKSAARKDALAAAALAASGIVVFCEPLYDTPYAGRGPAWQTELTRWLAEEARSRGKDLSLEDAYELQQLVGSNLRELVAELEKLVTFVGPRKRIDANDLAEAVGATRTSPAFRLAEAIASADLEASLRLSAELFERGAGEASGGRRVTDEGGIAMMLIGATAQKLRRVGTVLDALSRGAPFEEALATVRTHPAFRHQLEQQVDAWEGRSIGHATRALVELEKDLKSAGGPPRELVDRFLVTALGAGAPKRRRRPGVPNPSEAKGWGGGRPGVPNPSEAKGWGGGRPGVPNPSEAKGWGGGRRA
jgi:DNA polymerase III delta subunit